MEHTTTTEHTMKPYAEAIKWAAITDVINGIAEEDEFIYHRDRHAIHLIAFLYDKTPHEVAGHVIYARADLLKEGTAR
jgi:hypothetical protein